VSNLNISLLLAEDELKTSANGTLFRPLFFSLTNKDGLSRVMKGNLFAEKYPVQVARLIYQHVLRGGSATEVCIKNEALSQAELELT
jgi:hypothetical protein